MKKLTIFFILSSLIFSFCGHKTHKNKIAKIDTLLQKINVIQESINKIDTSAIATKAKEFNTTAAKLNSFNKNTLSDSLKTIIFRFEELNNNFFSKYKLIIQKNSSDLKKSKTQLENLKDDLSNNLIPKEKIWRIFYRRKKRTEYHYTKIQYVQRIYRQIHQLFQWP